MGVYAGYNYSIDKFSARAGGRMEGAWYAVNSVDDGDREKYTSALINVVPYASLTYMPKQGHSIALSYTERLSRPGIYAMSPFVNDSYYFKSYGNPNLKTGVSHKMSLKYSYSNNKWNATVEGFTMLSNNMVSQYVFMDDGIYYSTYTNKGKVRAYSGRYFMSFRPSSKFNLSLSVMAGWESDCLPLQNYKTSGVEYNQQLNMTIALWKGARLTLSEQAYNPGVGFGQYYKNCIVGTSVNLGQKLFKDKFDISLFVTNPHSKYSTVKMVQDTPSYLQNIKYRTVGRTVRLSISYRFGKQGLNVRSTNRKEDDCTSNIGNSGGGR